MELLGLINALEMALSEFDGEYVPTTVYCDSKYVVSSVTKWLPGWKRRGWKKQGGSLKNVDLLKHIDSLKPQFGNLSIRWVRGHNGNKNNELSDQLATEAIRNKKGLRETTIPQPTEKPELDVFQAFTSTPAVYGWGIVLSYDGKTIIQSGKERKRSIDDIEKELKKMIQDIIVDEGLVKSHKVVVHPLDSNHTLRVFAVNASKSEIM
jgi:ribonuclease HI